MCVCVCVCVCVNSRVVKSVHLTLDSTQSGEHSTQTFSPYSCGHIAHVKACHSACTHVHIGQMPAIQTEIHAHEKVSSEASMIILGKIIYTLLLT